MSGKREVKVVISGDPAGGVGALRKFDSQAASTAEHTKGVSAKIGGAFSKIGSQLGGEFGEIVNRIGEGIDQVGEHGKSLATGLKVAGTAATGIGLALQAAGSKDKQAQDQLKAAIDATGGAWGDYREEVEKAIKTGENYGHTADDTQQAIMKITAATQDPKKAIEDMSLVENLAAAQHVSLADAASQVAKVYGGAGRVLKQYGITLESSKTATAALSTAQRQHHAALDQLAHAQRTLADLEEVDRSKKKLSISQEIQLRNARDAVKTATEKVKTTTADLGVAQDKAAKSTGNADVALQQLGKRLDGQASASVDNFSGRVHVLMARADDWVAQMGQRFGPAITATGPLLLAGGLALDVYQAHLAKTAATQAALAATAEASAATVGEADATIAAETAAAGEASSLALGPIGLAVAAIGVGLGIAATKFHWFGIGAHDQVKPVQSLTDAIVADKDAIGALTQAQIANTLQSKGLYDAALTLGVGQGTLTSAAMGNAKALGLVNDAIDAAKKRMADNKRPAEEFIAGTLNQTQASKDAYAAWRRSQQAILDQLTAAQKLQGGLAGLKGQLDASFHAAENLAIANGKAKEASLTHAAAVVAASSKLDLESLAAQTVITKLHGVHDAIDKIPATKQTAVTVAAQIALARLQSVHDLVDSIPRSFTINIGANNNVGRAVHDAVNSIPGKPGNNAVGTEFWRGGLTEVNESGPELIDLPRGSAVHPANESSRMLAAAAAMGAQAGASGGGDIFLTNIVTLDGAVVHKSLIKRRRDLGGSGLGLDG